MALIKTVLFLKKWDSFVYEDKVLKIGNPIAAVVEQETFESTAGHWPDIYQLSFKTEDHEISDTWQVDGISSDLQSQGNTIVGVQSGGTLILFDPKMYESYLPNTDELYESAVNAGVKVNTKDDLFI